MLITLLIYLLSENLCLFSGLCYVRPYLLYVFPVVLFIIPGVWIKVILLLYCVTPAYDIIKLVVVRLIWYLYSALLSSLYFGNHLSETINRYTPPVLLREPICGEDKREHSPTTSLSPSPPGYLQKLLRILNLWYIQTSVILLLSPE